MLTGQRCVVGSERADAQHPPGQSWRGDVSLRGGRLWQGQDDVSEKLDGLAAQVADVEEALAPYGLAPLEVFGGMVFVGRQLGVHSAGRIHVLDDAQLLRWVRARGQRLEATRVAELTAALAEAASPCRTVTRTPVPLVRAAPKPRESAQASLFTTQALDLTELERASRLPLEQWMTYLHPAQVAAVRKRYGGPSRIRGPAGCGKTVVALHRAAYLASQEPGGVLVVSYVKTLPVVLSSLYRRLSPQTASRVTFSGIHRLASDICRDIGQEIRLDGAETCFNLAWCRTGREHLSFLPLSYWREEVLQVIKGRGLTDFEDYRQLARTGRRTALGPEQRARVWDLYVDYERRLAESELHDFVDVSTMALKAVLAGEGPRFRFVLVDEVQDLDLVSLRLAAALTTEEQDGLTLVGDGQQSLYPGGYLLKEAGLAVAGSSLVLNINYRNTRQILDAAYALISGDSFDDLDDIQEEGSRAVEAVREGPAVLVATAADAASLDLALSLRLEHDRAIGLPDGDAAVLCRTGWEADRLRSYLRASGHPVMDLLDYTGNAVAAIKVGTVKRAKGLEFGRVYLPGIDGYLCADEDAEIERVERERRELFVAMTRARDGVWRSQLKESASAEANAVVSVAS